MGGHISYPRTAAILSAEKRLASAKAALAAGCSYAARVTLKALLNDPLVPAAIKEKIRAELSRIEAQEAALRQGPVMDAWRQPNSTSTISLSNLGNLQTGLGVQETAGLTYPTSQLEDYIHAANQPPASKKPKNGASQRTQVVEKPRISGVKDNGKTHSQQVGDYATIYQTDSADRTEIVIHDEERDVLIAVEAKMRESSTDSQSNRGDQSNDATSSATIFISERLAGLGTRSSSAMDPGIRRMIGEYANNARAIFMAIESEYEEKTGELTTRTQTLQDLDGKDRARDADLPTLTNRPKDTVYGSFDSVETAKSATGGRVYEFKGYEEHAIVVEDQSGRNWLYAKPESAAYREVANIVWGYRMSSDKKDADHVASRGIESAIGQGYVLIAAVDRSANRSHGSFEKMGKHADRLFNAAAQQLDPCGLALAISHRQAYKLAGYTKADMKNEDDLIYRSRPSQGDVRFEEATFGSEQHQERLSSLKGKEL